MLRILLFAAMAFTVLSSRIEADTIHFVGVPTMVNDGAYYVTPYEVTINGTPQLVTCYDTHDDVNFGDTWEANLLTLDQAANSGYFAGINALSLYQRVAWLDAQQYSTPAQQVGLQHAIWNVFGSAASTSDSLAYEAAAAAAAAGGSAGFDFSNFRFIEEVGGVPGQHGTVQALVFDQYSSTVPNAHSVAAESVPEPNSFSFWICALAMFGVWHYAPQHKSPNRRAQTGAAMGQEK